MKFKKNFLGLKQLILALIVLFVFAIYPSLYRKPVIKAETFCGDAGLCPVS